MTIDLTGALIGGIPLLVVTIGLVQWAKTKMGLSGKPAEIFAIAVGFVFGVLYSMYMAEGEFYLLWRFWVEAAIYGLALGLTATGIYDTARGN